jgi:hypothetical protein
MTKPAELSTLHSSEHYAKVVASPPELPRNKPPHKTSNHTRHRSGNSSAVEIQRLLGPEGDAMPVVRAEFPYDAVVAVVAILLTPTRSHYNLAVRTGQSFDFWKEGK